MIPFFYRNSNENNFLNRNVSSSDSDFLSELYREQLLKQYRFPSLPADRQVHGNEKINIFNEITSNKTLSTIYRRQ